MSRAMMLTGASSGIGKAVALEMAGRGYRLGLTARRIELLEALRDEILARYPDTLIAVRALDVNQYEDIGPVLRDLAEELSGLDIVFANAGIGLGGRIGASDFSNARRTIETNVIGAMATLDAAVAYFRERGQGHVVGTSSVAAFRGMPGNAAYSASKAALATYMDALRSENYHRNIDVTVLYPGFIDTPINDMLTSRPFLITAEKGARIIADRIEQKAKSAVVPAFPWVLARPLLKWIPTRWMAGSGMR